jgi:hypothetical protein
MLARVEDDEAAGSVAIRVTNRIVKVANDVSEAYRSPRRIGIGARIMPVIPSEPVRDEGNGLEC